jgi:hypothetical protein
MSEREVVLTEEKPWWASKTLLFNMLVGGMLALEMNMPSLQGFVDPEMYAYLLLAVNIVNVLLRIVTSAPLTLK